MNEVERLKQLVDETVAEVSALAKEVMKDFPHPIDAVKIPAKELTMDYLAMAGDPESMFMWMEQKARIYGWPQVRTEFIKLVKQQEKKIDKVVENGA